MSPIKVIPPLISVHLILQALEFGMKQTVIKTTAIITCEKYFPSLILNVPYCPLFKNTKFCLNSKLDKLKGKMNLLLTSTRVVTFADDRRLSPLHRSPLSSLTTIFSVPSIIFMPLSFKQQKDYQTLFFEGPGSPLSCLVIYGRSS